MAAGGVNIAEVVLHGEVVAELEVRRAGAMDGVHCLGIEADACYRFCEGWKLLGCISEFGERYSMPKWVECLRLLQSLSRRDNADTLCRVHVVKFGHRRHIC